MFCFLDLFSVVNLLAFHGIKQMVPGEETIHFLLQFRQAGAANQKHHKTAYLMPDWVNPLTMYLLANMKMIMTGSTETTVDAIIRPGFV